MTPQSDLTPEEFDAQSYDGPTVDIPVLPDEVLALDAEEFLRYLARHVPKASDDAYGTPATDYAQQIAVWLEANG